MRPHDTESRSGRCGAWSRSFVALRAFRSASRVTRQSTIGSTRGLSFMKTCLESELQQQRQKLGQMRTRVAPQSLEKMAAFFYSDLCVEEIDRATIYVARPKLTNSRRG